MARRNMRKYFERIENCRHRPYERFCAARSALEPEPPWLVGLAADRKGRGRRCDCRRADPQGHRAGRSSNTLKEFGAPSLARLEALFDPNDWRVVERDDVGAHYTPLTTRQPPAIRRARAVAVGGETVSRPAADRVERARHAGAVRRSQSRDRRRVSERRAALRRASRRQRRRRRDADRNGAPRGHSRRRRVQHAAAADAVRASAIPTCSAGAASTTRVALPGVGRNLQDRYEVAVVNRMKKPWEALNGATFTTADPQYRTWAARRKGVYTTNGTLLSVIAALRSGQTRARPVLLRLARRLSRLPARILRAHRAVNTTI